MMVQSPSSVGSGAPEGRDAGTKSYSGGRVFNRRLGGLGGERAEVAWGKGKPREGVCWPGEYLLVKGGKIRPKQGNTRSPGSAVSRGRLQQKAPEEDGPLGGRSCSSRRKKASTAGEQNLRRSKSGKMVQNKGTYGLCESFL